MISWEVVPVPVQGELLQVQHRTADIQIQNIPGWGFVCSTAHDPSRIPFSVQGFSVSLTRNALNPCHYLQQQFATQLMLVMHRKGNTVVIILGSSK